MATTPTVREQFRRLRAEDFRAALAGEGWQRAAQLGQWDLFATLTLVDALTAEAYHRIPSDWVTRGCLKMPQALAERLDRLEQRQRNRWIASVGLTA